MVYEYKVIINNNIYYMARSTNLNQAIKKVSDQIKKDTR